MKIFVGLRKVDNRLYNGNNPIYGYANDDEGKDEMDNARANVAQIEFVNPQSTQE